jgi:L-threonylcarbamoyladenylate synthase
MGLITRVFKINRNNIDIELIRGAARVIQKGGLVAFPTETVYGLGANALDANAVEKIFQAKGRPCDNPLIVHISKTGQLKGLVPKVSAEARMLMDKYWPGPLTLILKKSSSVPDQVTAGLGTVAVRMPSHPVAKALIEEAGVPIAAPSANLSGKPSPTTAKHVIEDMWGKVEIIIDSGAADIGVESTVLDVSKTPFVILRPGGVSLESIARNFKVRLHKGFSGDEDIVPEAPGMKYRHYAPKARLIVFNGTQSKLESSIRQLSKALRKGGLKVGVLSPFKGEFSSSMTVTTRSSKAEFATELFNALRRFDEHKIDIILVAGVKARGIGSAVMNRLEKAAVYKVINL